ncbi:hypothetical protein DRO30_01515, partial [Candidatus Bathyarchaeota archaeon]
NLYAAIEFFNFLLNFKLPGYLFYWNSTRVIENTINEFPYFSFIHADYHAHEVAIPIKILALVFAYEYFTKKSLKSYLLLVFLTFILYLTNSWDFPVFVLFLLILILIRPRKKLKFELILLAFLILLVYAYTITFMSISSSRIVFVNERTNIFEFVEFWFFQLLLAYLYLVDKVSTRFLILVVLLSISLSLLVPIAVLVLPLVILSARKIKKDFLSILIFVGAILLLLPEIIGFESRLNTVFKFYLVSWIFISIPAGIKLVELMESKSKYLKTVAACMLVLSLIYPSVATPIRHYKAEFSLNGMDFVKRISIGDYEGIMWLKDKRGNIIEASADCYTYGGRFAAFTGNPTLIGWACHEVQWRQNPKEIIERMRALDKIYTSYNCDVIWNITKKYKIKYLIIGFEERKKYNVNDSIFDKCGFKKVFEKHGTKIYECMENLQKKQT